MPVGLGGFLTTVRRVNAELVEDDAILDYGPERTKQPRGCRDEILSVLGIAEDAQAIRQVTYEGQQEEQQGKTWRHSISKTATRHGKEVSPREYDIPSQDLSR